MTAPAKACPSCGELSPGQAKFCESCGASLAAPSPTASAPPPVPQVDPAAANHSASGNYIKGSTVSITPSADVASTAGAAPSGLNLEKNYIKDSTLTFDQSVHLDQSVHHNVSNVSNISNVSNVSHHVTQVFADAAKERIREFRDWILGELEVLPLAALTEGRSAWQVEAERRGMGVGERIEAIKEAASFRVDHLRQRDREPRYRLSLGAAAFGAPISLDALVGEINRDGMPVDTPRVQRVGEGVSMPLWKLPELYRRDDVTFRCFASREVVPATETRCCGACERLFHVRLVDESTGLCRTCAAKTHKVVRPSTALHADPKRRDDVPDANPLRDRTRALGLAGADWVWVDSGSYTMGSEADETGRDVDETPHRVFIGASFWVARCPVTEAMWADVRGGMSPEDPNLPRTSVSWFDAVVFCNALSEAMHIEPVYAVSGAGRGAKVTWLGGRVGVRLLTEAEWEYCCRAGGASWWVSDPPSVAVFDQDFPDEVASRDPNPWGLRDMLGNVWEWVWDAKGRYASGEVSDPVIDGGSPFRICRGGSYADPVQACRPAKRHSLAPHLENPLVGLRVAVGYRETEGVSE